VARGYLRRPQWTAERFVPSPLHAQPGWRLYRTGDRVRFLSDGRLDFLGRADHQVKLRGYRIELGEIEAALMRSPAVRDCIVLAPEDRSGDRSLVAYVVATPGSQPEAEALRVFLMQTLPQYMVPSRFVFPESLPLTPTGKVDRQALAELDLLQDEPAERYVAPRDDVERRLAGIWEEVLGRPFIDVRAHFFHLGGHSLLAVQLMARIRREFGKDL
ncbi:MAG: AMP-binding protein, partial [bacterium]|nr:AMP-binding protein [bacterium]